VAHAFDAGLLPALTRVTRRFGVLGNIGAMAQWFGELAMGRGWLMVGGGERDGGSGVAAAACAGRTGRRR
jgi:hypothetical protein